MLMRQHQQQQHHHQQQHHQYEPEEHALFSAHAPPPAILTTADMQRLRESYTSRMVASSATSHSTADELTSSDQGTRSYTQQYPLHPQQVLQQQQHHASYDLRWRHESHTLYPETTADGSFGFEQSPSQQLERFDPPARFAVQPMSRRQHEDVSSWPPQQHPHEFQSSGPLFAAGSSSGDSNL
ncbi:hypothetical protein Gpo141_00011661, partial [Globisporangium polare]